MHVAIPSATPSTSLPVAVLEQLWVYPLKSAAGVALARSEVAPRGLLHDRRFMVVDPAGMLVTLRERAELALVRTAVDGDCLRLSAPGTPPLTVPLEPGGVPGVVFMWTTPVDALVVEAASAWLGSLLGGDYRLVWMPDESRRPYPGRTDTPLSFVDGNPLHLLSEASLADLNGRLGTPVAMTHFRPNLVVSGCAAYAEDTWETLQIGNLTLERLGPCARCAVVNVDPDTATPDREPLRTLARYRRVGREVHFGAHFRIVSGVGGVISRGDPLFNDRLSSDPLLSDKSPSDKLLDDPSLGDESLEDGRTRGAA